MTARRKTLNTVLRYRGYHGCPSLCRVCVYEGPDGKGIAPVLVATEMESNPGTSVTNRIEVIATEIYRLLERPQAGLTVIEHYGACRIAPERFSLVTLHWDRCKGFVSPRWRHLTQGEVESMVGARP
ncbi:MAG: hypothetical protein V4671_29215 [Armatimonadota bacterium]